MGQKMNKPANEQFGSLMAQRRMSNDKQQQPSDIRKRDPLKESWEKFFGKTNA